MIIDLGVLGKVEMEKVGGSWGTYWQEAEATIFAEGYTDTGLRVYVVDDASSGPIFKNALLIGIDRTW